MGAVLRDFREVVVEREMDDPVRSRRAFLEAFQILKDAAVNLGAGGGQNRRLVVGSGEAEHPMSRRDQLAYDRRADPACGAGDEYAHEQVSKFPGDKSRRLFYSGKVVTLSW